MHPPFLNAGNASPFTLDGTRTYRVGRRKVALIDPGPDVEDHIRALVTWVEDAEAVSVLVTHGHWDHAAAARGLADRLGVPVSGPAAVSAVDVPLSDGDRVETDEGTLLAVHTPGHSADHLCYLWIERDVLFAGDLFLGKGDTTWVGEYPGCVGDYLASLERVRALSPRLVCPAHGPPIEDVPGMLDRYEAHRRARIRRVADIVEAKPDLTVDELMTEVYGTALPSGNDRAARGSVEALLEYVRNTPER